MAYTPINWQTGDTITAEKLNKMDNGWGVQETQLFSETVTTVSDDNGNSTALSYEQTINEDSITVTFDGTDYDCERIDFIGNYFYGGFSTEPPGPDYTTYPFFIAASDGNTNVLYTQTAGEHSIAVNGESMQCSDDFTTAVKTCVDTMPMLCVFDVTTYEEMDAAKDAGRLLYFYADSGMHIITSFGNYESATAVNALPAGVVGSETYGFDSHGVFTLYIA